MKIHSLTAILSAVILAGVTVSSLADTVEKPAGEKPTVREEQALKLRKDLAKRVEAGDPESMMLLATVKEQGDPSEASDIAGAYALYEQAAKRGNPIAIQKMCLAYLLERGRSRDVAKAAGFCNKIDSKTATYLFWGAYDYQHGLSGPKDLEAAAILYDEAVTAGSGEAADALGQMALQQGGQAIARNWYRRAATMGSLEALSHLAAMAEQGQGGDKDIVQAAWLYGLAAQRGNAAAQTWFHDHAQLVVPETLLAKDGREITLTNTYGQGADQKTEQLTSSRLNTLLQTRFYGVTTQGLTPSQQYVNFECYVGASRNVELCVTTREFPPGIGMSGVLQAVWGGRISLPERDAEGKPTGQSYFRSGLMIIFPN